MNDMTRDHESIARKLRDLPNEITAPYDWTEFKVRSRQRHDRAAIVPESVDNRWRIAAIAAGFALIIAGLALWSRFDRAELALNPDFAMSEPAQEPVADWDPSDVTAASRWLASSPAEPTIVRVDTRFAVADLEDRIAWLDDLLTTAQIERVQPAHIKTLRRERAELVDSLAKVRYAETLAAELP
jgi:hypothetical protein